MSIDREAAIRELPLLQSESKWFGKGSDVILIEVYERWLKRFKRVIDRIVKNVLKIKSYRVRKIAILSNRNKHARLKKCKALLSGTRQGTHVTTAFTDEKLFNLEAESNPQNHCVLAHGPQEVFGGITFNGKTPLVFVEPGVKVDHSGAKPISPVSSPVKVLEVRLSDFVWTDEKIFTIEPLPKRQKIINCCQRMIPKSPKRRVVYKKLFPKSIMVWTGLTAEENKILARSHPNIESHKQALLKAWSDIDDDYFRRTVNSVPTRLKASTKSQRIKL
uniref:Uncharacterized protein n=1 Tax=Caenorhabditis japonica TaxID=281687 RepID=A0A8R1DYK9_CAEJA